MNKTQVAMLGLKGAVLEAAFFLDLLLSNYQAIKLEKPLPHNKLGEISYIFNAFVRSGKSALEVLGKISNEGKKKFLIQLEGTNDFKYLMQLARNIISHGSGDLLSGSIEIEYKGQTINVLVCSPLNEGEPVWIKPPNQDGISLALDYLISILEEAEKSYVSISALPTDYWHGIRAWEIEGMKATVHVSPKMIEMAKQAQLTIPSEFVPDLVDTSWVGRMIYNYKNLRATIYPTILIDSGRYHLSLNRSLHI
jgi:hypothetical protein